MEVSPPPRSNSSHGEDPDKDQNGGKWLNHPFTDSAITMGYVGVCDMAAIQLNKHASSNHVLPT